MQFFGSVEENLMKDFVSDYLKMKGIKFKQPKRAKEVKNESYGYQLFQVPLGHLKTIRVDVSDRSTDYVQIPEFLVSACNAIERDIYVEGIFRKAGSVAKQKELKRRLNSGKDLPSTTHVIDICNLVKMFFRELPEPIFPYSYHDSLLNCLLHPTIEDQAETALISCLMLPRENIAIIMYFFRFLLRVAEFSDKNKMDVKNLAIVLTPSLMPLKNSGKMSRVFNLEHHISLVELLISHAHEIGLIPNYLLKKPSPDCSNDLNAQQQKRRKRTSSLARVLTGIRRMVQPDKPIIEVATPSIRKRRSCEPSLDSPAKRSRKELDTDDTENVVVTRRTSLRLSRMASYSEAPLTWNNARNKIMNTKSTQGKTLKSSKSMSALNVKNEAIEEKERKPETVALLASDLVTIPRSEYNEMKRRASYMDKFFQELHGEPVLPQQESPIVDQIRSTNNEEEQLTSQFQEKLTWTDATQLLTNNEDNLSSAKETTKTVRTRSSERRVIRSPSERKIGSIRRRSRELTRSLSIQTHERRDSIVSLRRTNLGNVMKTASYFDNLQRSSIGKNKSREGEETARKTRTRNQQPVLKPALAAMLINGAKTPRGNQASGAMTPRRKATPMKAFPDAITPLTRQHSGALLSNH